MVEEGSPAQYQPLVEELVRAREAEGGDVTVRVGQMVERLKILDRRLHELRAELRSGVRLYYDRTRDAFQIRQIIAKGWTIYQGKIVDEGVRRYLRSFDRVRITEAEYVLEERMRLKRTLQVIATIAEAMERWPEGRWQIRGKRAKGVPASWVTQSTERGLLTRSYGGGQGFTVAASNDNDDSIEWGDE
jgi:hypothetical protein